MRRDISAFRGKSFDVLVIGGGITGSCIARDAAMRGLSVALVEKKDFSHATSAANSKLVHGGLRYLQTYEFGLVRESLRERRIWQRIAPHLVHPLKFLVPQPKGHKGTLMMKLGLTLYDWLSFDRTWLPDPTQRLPGHRTVKPAELATEAPVVADSGYPDALSYYDCQMHAPERLGLACLADAVASGAVIANYTEVTALARDAAGGVTGAQARDLIGGETIQIAARCVVNAAGPWADGLMAMAQGGKPAHRLVRAKGIHIVVRNLTNNVALTVFTERGHFFVMPWRGHSLIGTTDDIFEGLPDAVTATDGDIDQLLTVVDTGLPAAKLTRNDVIHAYAGVRPLIADAASKGDSYKQSRKAEIIDHAKEGQPGFISALGGKWTTSRAVAAKTVDLVEKRLGRRIRRSPTDTTPLADAGDDSFKGFAEAAGSRHANVETTVFDNLARNYGTAFERVIAEANGDAGLLRPLSSALPDCGAEILYAVRHEMALTLEDALLRRTGIGTLGHPGADTLTRCAAIMAAELGWDAARQAAEIAPVEAHYRWPHEPPGDNTCGMSRGPISAPSN